MKLIDRYVNEVGKRLLVFQGREDIEKELRSTLEDMLEERAQKTSKPADEAMEIELLKEYGSPEQVAMTYNPHPYLIGPRIFPLFLVIMRIVLLSTTLGMSIVMVIQLITQSPLMGSEFTEILGNGLGNIFSTLISAAGYVVLAFAIIERTVPDLGISKEDFNEKWDPASLAKEPSPDSVKRGELITEIVFTFIGLAIINEIFYFPIFSDEFRKFVPWINVIFVTEILLDIYLLRKAVWDTATRLVKIVMEVGMIAIAFIMLKTPNLLIFTADTFKHIPENSSLGAEGFMAIANLSISIALIVVIIVSAVDLGKAVIGLWRSNRKS
ncbi:MAG: hypothetical protein UZ14_CFX002002352 [Chloroflexi bacterium OLB14]|nr:MAG: hypothetical protein UZ14_CFX002002352 [Chloroflexi bacterium OLB14]